MQGNGCLETEGDSDWLLRISEGGGSWVIGGSILVVVMMVVVLVVVVLVVVVVMICLGGHSWWMEFSMECGLKDRGCEVFAA